MEIAKTCLDCKFADWNTYSEGEGSCEWKNPVPFAPEWVHENNFSLNQHKIRKNKPYAGCPTWEEKEDQ